MLIHFAAVSSHLYFVQNAINSSWASFALTPAGFVLFSANVNHLIKCAIYTNTPLKRPKQETIRIFVINCIPCCNFTVNIGFLAAHEDRNTVKLQSRFSPIRLWPRWTTFLPNGSIAWCIVQGSSLSALGYMHCMLSKNIICLWLLTEISLVPIITGPCLALMFRGTNPRPSFILMATD